MAEKEPEGGGVATPSGGSADATVVDPPRAEGDSVEAKDPKPARGPRPAGTARSAKPARGRRWVLPLVVYLLSAAVYALVLGPRMLENSPDDHYAHLAAAWLDGRLHIDGDPPGSNDWACYDTELEDMCPNNRWAFPDKERYRWYVSFPPFPAAVILPAVAALGVDLPDRLFWALVGGLGPMLLLLLLGRLRDLGLSDRKRWEDLVLTALFAFGTVFFYVAVQGTVWFAAHVVAVPLILLFLRFALGAERPVLAGLMLGLCFLTRPTTAALALFFALEMARRHRRESAPAIDPEASWLRRAGQLARGIEPKAFLRAGVLFALPILACGAAAMWMNQARFGDPFEFGHTYLQIRWRPRIETWGLFNFHYFAKNLAVFTSSLPWLSAEAPYLKISRHGLALWVTTPALLLVLWPKPLNLAARRVVAFLLAAALPVAFWNLCYQNSGWVQFGYRFALDYLPLLFLVLALGRRPFRVGFFLLMVWSVAINLFGALTFDRAWEYYDNDPTQDVIFQPD
ncbi:MAG: hypothetical protein CMN30_24215 [Sandaracinus sp.]|nr:hypothetical protein [Sandaracinus sp.]|tara:strand:+ start:1212 stop:2750 length:1539 start_codon:yes stop_codon:yes gene_type:complete